MVVPKETSIKKPNKSHQPITYPESAAPTEKTLTLIAESLKDGDLSNFGALTQQAEKQLAAQTKCSYCYTFPNGTTALTAALMAGIKEKSGYVVCPSFTFIASALGIEQAGFLPAFADVNPQTLTVDPQSVERVINQTSNIKAVLGVHIFGNPCDIQQLTDICNVHGLPLIFDAAQAFGASYQKRKVGNFGICEAFSTSSTKMLTSAEGGFVATNNPDIAKALTQIRNYGVDRSTGKIVSRGVNGKMSELQAALLIGNLQNINKVIQKRKVIATKYLEGLRNVEGLSFQSTQPQSQRTFKDFPIIVNPAEYGHSRDELIEILAKENIETRPYFNQPLHMVERFLQCPQDPNGLVNTTQIANAILCLPLYSTLSEVNVEKIIKIIVENSKVG